MNVFRAWMLATTVILAGCGGDSIQSPDFTAETTVNSLALRDAEGTNPAPASDSVPAGGSRKYTAWANVTTTVPPGTQGATNGTVTGTGDVTKRATWTSSNTAVATVSGGMVSVLSSAAVGATTKITASYGGQTASIDLTVSDAVLDGVACVMPDNGATQCPDPAPTNPYPLLLNSKVEFSIVGHFSDGSTSLLDPNAANPYPVDWGTSDTAVIDNSATGDQNFDAVGGGSATVTGTMTADATGMNGPATAAILNPTSASANVLVTDNAFCLAEFNAITGAKTFSELSPLCLGCTVANEGNAIDGDIDTYATLSIPLALLVNSAASLKAYNLTSTPLVVGGYAGVVIEEPLGQALDLSILQNITLTTEYCATDTDCTAIQAFTPNTTVVSPDPNNPLGGLYLSLLGTNVTGDRTRYLLRTTDPVVAAAGGQTPNALKLTFNGGLLGALETLNVDTMCGSVPAP